MHLELDGSLTWWVLFGIWKREVLYGARDGGTFLWGFTFDSVLDWSGVLCIFWLSLEGLIGQIMSKGGTGVLIMWVKQVIWTLSFLSLLNLLWSGCTRWIDWMKWTIDLLSLTFSSYYSSTDHSPTRGADYYVFCKGGQSPRLYQGCVKRTFILSIRTTSKIWGL